MAIAIADFKGKSVTVLEQDEQRYQVFNLFSLDVAFLFNPSLLYNYILTTYSTAPGYDISAEQLYPSFVAAPLLCNFEFRRDAEGNMTLFFGFENRGLNVDPASMQPYRFDLVFYSQDSSQSQTIQFPMFDNVQSNIVFVSIEILFLLYTNPYNIAFKCSKPRSNFVLFWCYKQTENASIPFALSQDASQYIPRGTPPDLPPGYQVIGVFNYSVQERNVPFVYGMLTKAEGC